MIGKKRIDPSSGRYSRFKRTDAGECILLLLACGRQIAHVLEIEPVFRRCAKVFTKPERSGCSDSLASVNNGADATVWDAEILAKTVLGDAKI